MATVAPNIDVTPQRLEPDTFERVLAAGSVVLLGAVAVALARGWREWGLVPPVVWPHLVTIIVALALTPVQLLGRRGDGDRRHRLLGTIWVAAMLLSALFSFGLREINNGGLSVIHILSAWTLLMVPWIWWSARTHRVAMHRRASRGMVAGALLTAGFFTFPFNRLLGHWLFG